MSVIGGAGSKAVSNNNNLICIEPFKATKCLTEEPGSVCERPGGSNGTNSVVRNRENILMERKYPKHYGQNNCVILDEGRQGLKQPNSNTTCCAYGGQKNMGRGYKRSRWSKPNSASCFYIASGETKLFFYFLKASKNRRPQTPSSEHLNPGTRQHSTTVPCLETSRRLNIRFHSWNLHQLFEI